MKTKTTQGALPTQLSSYQLGVVGVLAFLQFAVILDFMLMAPLGALIMPALGITTKQFGLVISSYAFSAGISGLVMAAYADRFDRRKTLLLFCAGFAVATLWCGLAQSFESLLLARIATGLFGGVIGSVVLAIATDLFPSHMRGRVMGWIQTAFAASQVLGVPVGLYLSNSWNWHAPFLTMAALAAAGGLAVAWRLEALTAHLQTPQSDSPWAHLLSTLTQPRYVLAFIVTALLATGGFVLMPFSSAYVIHNLGIDPDALPTVYLITGLCTIFLGPLIGKASDSFGQFGVFVLGSVLSIIMVLIYTHIGPIPLAGVVAINAFMFAGIFSRMIPFRAIASSVPSTTQRGSFNAVSTSIQQLSGGLGSVVAGHIVTFASDGKLQNIDVAGYVVIGTSIVALVLLNRLRRAVNNN